MLFNECEGCGENMAFKMSDSQIESFTTDCVERIKKANNEAMAIKLEEWHNDPEKSIEDKNYEMIEMLIETMYSTISQSITAALCEYNRYN